MQDVVIVAATRTAIGSFQGSLANVPAVELGATVIRALLEKTFVALPRINAASEAVVMEAMPGIMTRVGDRLCVHLKCTPDQRREMKAGMAAALPSL